MHLSDPVADGRTADPDASPQTPPDATATYQILGSVGWTAMSPTRPDVSAGPIERNRRPPNGPPRAVVSACRLLSERGDCDPAGWRCAPSSSASAVTRSNAREGGADIGGRGW